MTNPKTVASYFDQVEGTPGKIARAMRTMIDMQWPELSCKLAWNYPCWSGQERVFSLIAHPRWCNLQLWSGARLAAEFPARIEGTGKALRHVKLTTIEEIDDELFRLMERAIEVDRDSPERVR